MGTSWIVYDTDQEGDTANDNLIQMRFWPYGTGFQEVGGGIGGESKIIDPSGGAACDSYATWLLQGTPAGAYEIQAYIPPWKGLTTDAQYAPGNVTIDQSANQGRWVVIAKSVRFSPGYYGYVSVSASLSSSDESVCDNGIVIFDAMKFTLVSQT